MSGALYVHRRLCFLFPPSRRAEIINNSFVAVHKIDGLPHLNERAQRQRVEDLVTRPEQQPPVGTRVLLEYLHKESEHHGENWDRPQSVPQATEMLKILRHGDRCSLFRLNTRAGRVSPPKTVGGVHLAGAKVDTACAP